MGRNVHAGPLPQEPMPARVCSRLARCWRRWRDLLGVMSASQDVLSSLRRTTCFHRFDMRTTAIVWGSCSCSALVREFRQSPDELTGVIKHQPRCTDPSSTPACFQEFVYEVPRGDLQDPEQPWARPLLPRGHPSCKQQCHVTVPDSNQRCSEGISKENTGGGGLHLRRDDNTPFA